MEDNNSKKILLTVLGVAILVVAVVGISFALFTSEQVTGENTITSGTVTMSFSEKTNGITLEDALPMSEADALAQLNDAGEYFDFDVVTTTSREGTVVPYTVTVSKIAGDLNNDQIAINLQKKGSGDSYDAVISNKKVSDFANGVIVNNTTNAGAVAGKTDSYRLRIWIDGAQNASAIEDKTYTLRVDVNGGM